MATLADLPEGYSILTPKEGGLEGEWDADGRRNALRFRFSWETAEEAMRAISGVPEVIGGTLVRSVPLQNPYVPTCYATSLRHRSAGCSGAISNARPYSDVFVDVFFEEPRWPIFGEDAYTSFRFIGSTNKITIPNTNFVFAGGVGPTAVVQQNVGIDVGTLGVEISRHWVADPTISMALLLPLLGKVSSVDLTIGALTFPAGTLLFPSATSDIRLPLRGEINASLSVTLSYRALPWNQAIRSDGVADTLVPAPFATADLRAIFAA